MKTNAGILLALLSLYSTTTTRALPLDPAEDNCENQATIPATGGNYSVPSDPATGESDYPVHGDPFDGSDYTVPSDPATGGGDCTDPATGGNNTVPSDPATGGGDYPVPSDPATGGGGDYPVPSDPATGGGDYQTPATPPPCNGTTPTGGEACPFGAHYAAILAEQAGNAGTKHTIDGMNGDCRGLDSVPVGSIQILTGVGSEVAAATEFANGLTLHFYPETDCGGTEIKAYEGNQPDLSAETDFKPVSVKFECNGKGTAAPDPSVPTFNVVLYEQADLQGIKHFIDAPQGQCRGLQNATETTGVNVASVQYVNAPGADPSTDESVKLPDDQATSSTLTFYSQYGCSGDIVTEVTGNNLNTCDPAVVDDCGVRPLSVMFNAAPIGPPSDGEAAPAADDQSAAQSTIYSAASTVNAGVAVTLVAISAFLFA